MWEESMKIIKIINVKWLDGKTVRKIGNKSNKVHLGEVRYRLGHMNAQAREKGGYILDREGRV